jgi:hypothetical protein
MLARLRARLTYANVVATLALFLALGGASYASARFGSGSIINNSVRTQDLRNNDVRSRDIRNNNIRSRDIRNRTITNADILTNTVTGRQVRESSLSKVPDANLLDGADGASYRVGCPSGTQRHGDGCIETAARAAVNYSAAARTCGTAGRRLSNPDELGSFGEQPGIELDNGDEWSAARDDTNAVTVDDGFAYAFPPASDTQAFRCLAPLSN